MSWSGNFLVRNPEKIALKNPNKVPEICWNYMQRVEVGSYSGGKVAKFELGLFGYSAYDAAPFFAT